MSGGRVIFRGLLWNQSSPILVSKPMQYFSLWTSEDYKHGRRREHYFVSVTKYLSFIRLLRTAISLLRGPVFLNWRPSTPTIRGSKEWKLPKGHVWRHYYVPSVTSAAGAKRVENVELPNYPEKCKHFLQSASKCWWVFKHSTVLDDWTRTISAAVFRY